MKINRSFFSNLAFNLAEKNLGKTSTNPSVGCLVVKNNSVISSASTSTNGRPHAEFNALNKNLNFRGSDLYVTLEPCTHYGITPPCVKIIKEKKIKNVYYCYDDPDLRTNKKAKKELKKNNINLKKISTIYKDFYKSYFFNKKKRLPSIDAKIAISKDNFTVNKYSKWITNLRSRKVSHLIRSKYDCIISTSESINKDNSLLNCRIKGLDNFKPHLVIIDRYLKIKKNLKLFELSKKRKTYIVTMSKNKKKIKFLTKKRCKIISINDLKDNGDFKILTKKLFNLGLRRILVESGLIFLKILLKQKLINNLFIFQSNKKLSKNGSKMFKISNTLNFKLQKQIKVNLDEDKLFKIKIK